VFEPTGSRRDVVSAIFNLPQLPGVEAVELPLGGRSLKVQPDVDSAATSTLHHATTPSIGRPHTAPLIPGLAPAADDL
jgi:hypothetical protein